MGTPIELGLRMATHIWRNRLRGRKRFPIITMLEPLETCNLTCKGCGRIREYRESVILKNKKLTVEECLAAVEEAGTPLVSIAGGEPLLHPQIDEIVAKLIEQKRFVYLCTNGILMEERGMQKIKPSKYFSWVVHLDGMRTLHDYWVEREGTWDKAMENLVKALDRGYRVCTNSTVFKESDMNDLYNLFGYLTDLGVEGIMLSAGYPFEDAPDHDVFMKREESQKAFRVILDPSHGFRFYNNPLYLALLRGEREDPCQAWTNPTYTPLGWRKPCYLIADKHAQDLDEVLAPEVWERYGVGKDPRCSSCMMHSGFEAGIVQQAFTSPRQFVALASRFLKDGRAKAKARKNGKRPVPVGDLNQNVLDEIEKLKQEEEKALVGSAPDDRGDGGSRE